METTNFESQNPIPDIEIPVLPSTPTPNKNIFKILFFIFLGLFLIISSIYLYLWVKSDQQAQNSQTELQNQVTEAITPTATLDETQDWQTYNNEEFYFKYPSNWNIENDSINKNNPSNILEMKLIPQKQEHCMDPVGNGYIMCLDNISISVDKNKDELNRIISSSNSPETSRNLIITKGEKGDIYKFDIANYYDFMDTKAVCYIFSDGKVLWITGSYLSESQEDIFSKIVASVKFY